MDNFAIIRSVGGYTQEALFNRELSSILSSFRGLRAVSSSYITNLGEELVMVALEGTFPILFRGSTYNIPAELYFPKEFPEVPPIVFIRPTATMDLKRGHAYMDSEGLVLLDYINQWHSSRSSLIGLMNEMQRVFGETPPVFAKPSNNSSGSSTSSVRSPMSYSTATVVTGGSHATHEQPSLQRASSYTSSLSNKQQLTLAIQEKLSEFYAKMRDTMDTQFHSQKKLDLLEEQVNKQAKSVTSKLNQVVTVNDQMEERIEHLRIWIQHKQKERDEQHDTTTTDTENEQEVKNLLQPSDEAGILITDCVSTVHALEDTLYALDLLMQNDLLPLGDYLKLVRKLSKQLFLKQAHISKIQRIQRSHVHR